MSSTKTGIQWTDATVHAIHWLMPQTPKGARLLAARRQGITLEEYVRREASGLKWCSRCRAWEPLSAFGKDASRCDGMAASCHLSRSKHAKETYTPRPRPAPGRRFVAARANDIKQAERRVNHLVAIGLLPRPETLPCADCGRSATPKKPNQYHHHRGYGPAAHESVVSLCRSCHTRRHPRGSRS